MKKILLISFALIFFGSNFAQSLEKDWEFHSIENSFGDELIPINSKNDFFTLNNGSFEYTLEAKNNLKASGDYIFQNDLLVLFYSKPNDTIRRYRVSKVTDSTLVFSENNIQYSFSTRVLKTPLPLNSDITESDIVAVQGFTIQSLSRGILGMFTLLVIAFLFSSNRKGINWRTVGIGLAFQLIIAIGVLKIG
ncbi:MAG: CNT family concentrative nucleoside transporter, partial [Ulvibacter sp.]